MTDHTVSPKNMHTDGNEADTTVTPCNMHTDLSVRNAVGGGITVTAKSLGGTMRSVTLDSVLAHRVGTTLGLAAAPAATPNAPVPVHPFNMHTDGVTIVRLNATGTVLYITGPADAAGGGTVSLNLTIDDAALSTLKGGAGM